MGATLHQLSDQPWPASLSSACEWACGVQPVINVAHARILGLEASCHFVTMADILYPQVIPISLNHLADTELWTKEKPYEIWMEKAPPGAQRTNVTFETVHDIPLTDIRQMDGRQPTLEKEGFEIFEQPFPEECAIDSVDDVDKPEKREAVSKYLKIMTDELTDRLGATRVLCYDWRVRVLTIYSTLL